VSFPHEPHVLDRIIMQQPQGTILAPMCAKEVYVLRTVGMKWSRVAEAVAQIHRELMAHPAAFGPLDFKLYVTRKASQGSVIQTIGQSLDLPQEVFEWPLSK
jgi:hypothetical protein